MTAIPPNTIGYGVVIVPALDEYQGMFIVDNEVIRPEAIKLQLAAMMNAPRSNPIGALQAAVVEGVITKNTQLTAAAAFALHGMTREKFWVITATMASGGTYTDMKIMAATTVEEARAEVEAMPEVVALKERLRGAIRERKQ